jgi:hypothetical protein
MHNIGSLYLLRCNNYCIANFSLAFRDFFLSIVVVQIILFCVFMKTHVDFATYKYLSASRTIFFNHKIW